jgi:hypothetical protein
MDKTNSKFEFNDKIIKELEENNKRLLKEKEDQLRKFEEIEKADQIRFMELQKNYVMLLQRSKDFDVLEQLRENEIIEAQVNNEREKRQKDERNL